MFSSSVFLRSSIFCVVGCFVVTTPLCECSTHWMVTEEGKVQTVADSLYNMAQSHDLVQFMRQDDRVRLAKLAQTDIDAQKSVINHHEKKDDPKIEEKLMTTDKDCLKAGKPLSQQDLFTSSALTVDSFGIETKELMGVPREIVSGIQPYCSDVYNLEFSMKSFEHLHSVRWRGNLSFGAERALSPGIHPGWPNLSDFGFAVAEALQESRDVWWLHNMAILYWRVMGNASAAIDCCRTSLHLAPREFLALPALNLASILHLASRSRDAAVVMDAVLTLNESLPSANCVAGDVYAVAIQYNKSELSFDRCVEMDPAYPGVLIRRAAVRCHRKLEKALETQHENLQKTLSELQSYQTRLRNYQTLHEQTYKHVADTQSKRQMGLIFDYFTYGKIKHLNCVWRNGTGSKYLDCDVEDESKYLNAKKKCQEPRSTNRCQKPQNKVHVTPGSLTQPAPVDFDKEKIFLDALEPLRNLALSEPSEQRKYPKMNKSEWTSADYVFLNELWPDEEDCRSNTRPLPSFKDLPHVFLSPKNKGFEVERLLTKYLNLGEGEEHPLPWYPPFCSTIVSVPPKLDLPCCDHLLGVQRAKKRDREQLIAEPTLRHEFLSLTDTNVETEAEMGQRILTLFRFNIGAKWLLLNLAALYWRVVGVAAESTRCLRLALSEQAERQYADVALVQLSQLATFAGDRLDDGIVLIKQAVQVDSREPASQFLLGYYLTLKGNYSGAQQHLTEALNLDPRFPGAKEALKSIRCQQRYTETEELHEENLPRKRPEKRKYFCIKVSASEERCYHKERMGQATSVYYGMSAESPMPVSATCPKGVCESINPVCVAPPPLAALLFPYLEQKCNPCDLGDNFNDCSESQYASTSSSKNMIGFVVEDTDERDTRFSSATQLSAGIAVEEEQEEVTLDADNVVEATGRELTSPPPVVKPPPSKQTVRYGIKLIESSVHKKKKNVVDEVTENGKNPTEGKTEGKVEGERQTIRPTEDPEEITRRKEETLKNVQIITKDKVDMDHVLKVVSELARAGDEKHKLRDSPLPEVLPTPYPYQIRGGARLVHSLPTSTAECAAMKKHVKLEQATSTWLSVTAKGVRLEQFIDFTELITRKDFREPVCPNATAVTMWTMDHLHKFKLEDNTTGYKPEKGLRDAFKNLGNSKDTLQEMATRLYRAMKNSQKNPQIHMNYEGGVHWSLTTVAALYWRVEGNLSMAVQCLRHSLNNAPYHMRDLALVSLSNVYHQAGMLHSALITAGAALQLSPRFVVIHFTLANIYSAMGNLDHAMMFYYSTLALQNNFDPARERIRAIYCITGRIPTEAEKPDD